MPESHTSDESRSQPDLDVTDIEPINLIGVDVEEYGWRYDRLRTAVDAHVEIFTRGTETLELGWAWSQDPGNQMIHLLSPIYINDTAWPVSSPADVARALDEDRRLSQPLSTIYDSSPRRHTPVELYRIREQIAEDIAAFRADLLEPERHEPTTGFGVEDADRPRTLDLDPNLPPWEMDHDGVVFDGPPQPQLLEPGDPDWPPWLSTEPLWDSPSPEESLSSDAMAMDSASEEPSRPRGYTIDDLQAGVHHDPWTWGDPEESARHARIGPEPDGPPWDVNDDRVFLGGEPEPRVMRVILPDGRTAYMDAPPPTDPEEVVSRGAMIVNRGNEMPASQRFAAMDPEQVEAARALLRDYPDSVPYDEVERRGLTLDDVSLVYRADIGDLPDVTMTDPWRPPAAAPWQPATAVQDPEHDDAQRDRQPLAGVPDVVLEPGGETALERLGLDTDGTGEAPETSAIRTALDRLVDGQVTDDDLDRIGITPDQYTRLVSGEVNADLERAADQHRAEPAVDAPSATAPLLPDGEAVGTSYANLTPEDHEANRRAAYDAWTNTVRREWAERDRAAYDTEPRPSAEDGAASQRRFDAGGTPAAADELGLEYLAAVDDGGDRGERPVVSPGDDASALNHDGDALDFPRLSRVNSGVLAADPHARFQHRLDRLQDRLNDIQQTLHHDLDQALHTTIQGIHESFARERAPTGDASPNASVRQGRHVNPDISDGLDPPYGYPAATDLADPQYQQSESNAGPNIEI